MPRRAIWKGAISFGMVAIPIKLYAATESKSIAFVTLHESCHTRLRQKRYCSFHDAEIEYGEIVKGYEYAKDQYVVMEASDFENLPVPSTHTVEITRFVDLESIDPMYFQRSYVLEPETVGEKPFYLLKKALETTRRVAIAKLSLRQKEHLCCLRPYEGGIAISTMYYPDEIRGTDDLEVPDQDSLVSDAELGMATMLIDQLTGEFNPEEYEDEYRGAMEQTIEARLTSAEPITAAPAPTRGRVVDLMAALRESIEAAKTEEAAAQDKPAKAPRSAKKKVATPAG